MHVTNTRTVSQIRASIKSQKASFIIACNRGVYTLLKKTQYWTATTSQTKYPLDFNLEELIYL
jgi:hypothetical protein